MPRYLQKNGSYVKEIQIEEITKAIQESQPNKSPGSDGLTSEFYKTFADILAPILLKCIGIWRKRKKCQNPWQLEL